MKKIIVPLLILCLALLAVGCQKDLSPVPTTQPEQIPDEVLPEGTTLDIAPDDAVDAVVTTDAVITDPADTIKNDLDSTEGNVTEPDLTEPESEDLTTIPGTTITPTEPDQTESATAPNVTTSPSTEPNPTTPPATEPPATEPITVTYQQYLFEMTGEQQQEFINSFGSYEAFFAWLNQAKAEYEDQRIPIDGTTPIKP